MGIGKLIVKVYTDNIARPINAAKVDVYFGNEISTFYTNEIGHTEEILLTCPDKSYSLEPQTRVRPYEVYDLKITVPGLETQVIAGVQVLADSTAIQEVYLNSTDSGGTRYTTIGEHRLWGNFSRKLVENPDELGSDTPMPRVLPTPIIPEYIIVHDGIPSNNSAPNYNVAYADYIKNVGSSEIYATWPKESIKANILAIMSFTLNRVYLEWYPSKGYNFTITTSTAYDQYYVHGRNIFREISDVVDQIFNQYIRNGSSIKPLFSQYNDGINVNNPGWLSQWGSVDLAKKGYNAIGIIQYYYGNSKSIITGPLVEGLPTSFPGYVLEEGMCGDPIQKIQLELNIINGSYPGIPKIIPTDGKFDKDTKLTVETFQKVFNLPITGKIDIATWYKISNVFIGVSNNAKGLYL